MQKQHISVMAEELILGLNIKTKGLYIDATFGAGGHSLKLLQTNQSARLISIDRDDSVSDMAAGLVGQFGGRFVFKNMLFSDISKACNEPVDGIMYDIGVSSMQIDQAERGFSFSKPGPLNMEMGLNALSAADIVNSTPQEELANIIYQYGEERKSRAIARKIVEYRAKKPIEDTLELANIVKSAMGKYTGEIHPATRTFQAIRIATNNELQELTKSIESAITMLNKGGRICVITFHSLEDRIVKNLFNRYSDKQTPRFDRNYGDTDEQLGSQGPACLKIVTKKPILATKEEIAQNPRARSAKLRIAEKI